MPNLFNSDFLDQKTLSLLKMRGCMLWDACDHYSLIFQFNTAGIGTLAQCSVVATIAGLPRLHRAGPSASLDKS